MTSAKVAPIPPAVYDVALDATPRQQNVKKLNRAEATAAPKPTGEGAVDESANPFVPSTRRRGNRCQRTDNSYHDAENDTAKPIYTPCTKRNQSLPSVLSMEDESPVKTMPDGSSPMATATVCLLCDNYVSAFLLVGVFKLQKAQANVVVSMSFQAACRQAPGFDESCMGQGDHGNVHKLLNAAHILQTHRAHIFPAYDEVYCLRGTVWLRATFLKFCAQGVTAIQMTSKSWQLASKHTSSA